ncbi:hypothetical protein HDU86_008360 [Geranomyces michiganensis]|nr:hypothetical protein HDU86_008360 [Geranomyces michiganensis]
MAVPSLFGAVDAILVAEFDIDKGSALTFQYPCSTGTDAHVLSELMLPDGAHNREEDWTMFLLNQTEAADEKTRRARRLEEFIRVHPDALTATAYKYDSEAKEWSMFGQSPNVLLHLTPNGCLLWDDRFAESVDIPGERAGYSRAAPLCVYVYTSTATWGIRFLTEEDEVHWLDYMGRMRGACNPGREIPPSPPTLFEEDESRPPRPSTYVLNLVRTKHISNVRRGARVKAMAVASRYQWVHVFKPLLVLALDKFFNEPTIVILEELYHAINSMDMSRMPRLSIRQKNIFRDAEDNTVLDDVLKDDEATLGPIISHTKSGSTSSDATQILASDGPVATSAAAAASLKKLGKDRQYFETTVVYGGIKMPVRIPLALYPEEVGESSLARLLLKFGHATAIAALPSAGAKDGGSSGSASNTSSHSAPTMKWRNAVPYCWHPHLDIGPFTHPILVLLNAILTEKRVVFLGDKRPSGEVADYVLAACALVGGGGLLRGFTERCFPYVSLPGLDQLLAVPGFIAGVTNPVFEEQQAWWDVLCNISTGKITVSQRLIQASPPHDRETSREREKEWFKTSGYETDHDFIPEAMAAAQAHASEFYIRQKFLAYIRRFADVTAAYEDHLRNEGNRKTGYDVDHLNIGRGPFFVNERACLREMTLLRNRVEGWRSTRSYMYYKQDLPTMIQRHAVADLDPRYTVALLRSGAITHSPSVSTLFQSLQSTYGVADANMVEELLSLLPQSQAGLYPLATGLFHGRWETRRATVRILRIIAWDRIGRKFISHLNPMIRMTYIRVHREFYGDEPVPGIPIFANSDIQPSTGAGAVNLLRVPESEPAPRPSNPPSARTSPSSSPVPPRAAANMVSSVSQSSLASSITSTPPSTAPVSPMVKRMLLQQQHKQEQLKAKLSALGNEASESAFQDTLNPDFAARRELPLPSLPDPVLTDERYEQQARSFDHLSAAVGDVPLAPKRLESMPASGRNSPHPSPPRLPPPLDDHYPVNPTSLPPLVITSPGSPRRNPRTQLIGMLDSYHHAISSATSPQVSTSPSNSPHSPTSPRRMVSMPTVAAAGPPSPRSSFPPSASSAAAIAPAEADRQYSPSRGKKTLQGESGPTSSPPASYSPRAQERNQQQQQPPQQYAVHYAQPWAHTTTESEQHAVAAASPPSLPYPPTSGGATGASPALSPRPTAAPAMPNRDELAPRSPADSDDAAAQSSFFDEEDDDGGYATFMELYGRDEDSS